MRLKMKEFFSFLVALAFLVGWVAGANAGFKAVWNQPVHTSNDGVDQQNGKVCQDPSGNTAIVWDNGTDVFMQLISPDGMRLLTGEPGALTYGYTVLDRSSPSSLTLDEATCLADGSVFVVAHDNRAHYMQLVSGGARQWGLDADNKYGKTLVSGTFSQIALLPSGSNVVVAFGNSTVTSYTMVDSAGNKDCGGQDKCDISGFGSNDKLAVFPGSDFWLVGASGGTFKVYGVSGDSYEEAYNGSYSGSILAISDGSGGVLVYNGTNVIRVCDISNHVRGTVISGVTSMELEGNYLYVANATKLCKYELSADCSAPSYIWCTNEPITYDSSTKLTLVGDKVVLTRKVGNDLKGILIDDENGKIILDDTIFHDSTFSVIANVDLFGGDNSAYAVFKDDNTSLKRYAELKFTWTIAPDFTVSGVNVFGEVSTAEDRPLVVQFTANNTGSLDAPSDVVVKFYLTNSTSLDEKVLVGEYTVPAADLKAGSKSKTYSGITLTISKDAANEILKKVDIDASRHLYLAAVINEDKTVTEDDYDNNFAVSSNIPNDYVYAPDLTISCPAPRTTGLKAGDTVTITCTVQNNGSAPAENVEVAFKYDKVVLNSMTIASLASRGSKSISANVTLPTYVSDNVTITAQVDPNNLIGESNDNNNSDDITFSGVTTGPDLVVDAAAVNPVTVTPGMEVTASVVVKNIGGATASASVLNLYLSTDNSFDSGDTLLAAQAIDSLDSKASVAKTIYFDVPNNIDAGTYYVLFVADAANTVDELNENNNVYAQQITVTGAGANCPDLTLVVSNVGGNAEIWVAVPSCGDYCGFPATVAIQADLDGDSAVDYSFVPGMGYYGWVPGEQTFVYPLSVVPAVPVLDDWMGVPYSALSNATITFNVQVGECNVTETWTP